MRAAGTFSVNAFAPVDVITDPAAFTIVPSSGTGELAGIFGSGGMAIDADGTHRIWFDYETG